MKFTIRYVNRNHKNISEVGATRIGDGTYIREVEERHGDFHLGASWYRYFVTDRYAYKSDSRRGTLEMSYIYSRGLAA